MSYRHSKQIRTVYVDLYTVIPFSAQANVSLQIRKVISGLTDQYKTKEEDFESFKQDYNIRPAS